MKNFRRRPFLRSQPPLADNHQFVGTVNLFVTDVYIFNNNLLYLMENFVAPSPSVPLPYPLWFPLLLFGSIYRFTPRGSVRASVSNPSFLIDCTFCVQHQLLHRVKLCDVFSPEISKVQPPLGSPFLFPLLDSDSIKGCRSGHSSGKEQRFFFYKNDYIFVNTCVVVQNLSIRYPVRLPWPFCGFILFFESSLSTHVCQIFSTIQPVTLSVGHGSSKIKC